MTILNTLLLGLLLAVCTTAQKDGSRASSSSKVFQPWLLGLTATVVFLFIVFSLMIINRLFCKKKKNEFEEENKERVTMNIYDNVILDDEETATDKKTVMEEMKKAKWDNEKEEQKITAM